MLRTIALLIQSIIAIVFVNASFLKKSLIEIVIYQSSALAFLVLQGNWSVFIKKNL